jgi:glycosyltransferase involved in cell wall biosynthesis
VPGGHVFTLSTGMKVAVSVLPGLRRFYEKLFSDWPPHAILTHLDGSLEAASYACEHDINCVHFVRDADHPYNFAPLMAPWIDRKRLRVVANSIYIHDMLAARYATASTVVYPEPFPCDCNVSRRPQSARLRVLYVNPHVSKGAQLALRIMKALPNLEFHVVEGWCPHAQEPFAHLRNVVVHQHAPCLCKLYQSSDVVLVPSLRPEAFSRVAVEGMQHGLVVLAARHTGLIESVGNGGILVEQDGRLEPWIDELRRLSKDRDYWAAYSQKGRIQWQALYRRPPTDVLLEVLNASD